MGVVTTLYHMVPVGVITKHILVSRFHAEQLFPMPFEGAKVMIQKGLSNHFQTMHTLVLGASPSWQYGATYVGTKKLGENEVSYET